MGAAFAGAQTTSGARMNPAATRSYGPGVVQTGNNQGGQMSPLAVRSYFGPSNLPSSGTAGIGTNSAFAQMTGRAPQTSVNGSNPFGAQMSTQVLPNAANGFNPFASMMSAGGIGSAFPNGLGIFNSGYGFGNGGYYGGYYGFGDPTIAITPNGPVALDNGYNNGPSDWQILRSAYAQGYQDAANQAALNEATANVAAPYPTGMTASPRGAIARVPHGSDGAKVWRVGNGQVAVRWQGDSRVASSVTVSVTDRAGRALRSTTLTQLPAEVHFTPPSNAVFYQVVVHYVDGANNTIMGRLP